MIIFLTLLSKIIPLYALIFFGFTAGRFLKVQKESIATILIYIISPFIFFNAAATTPISLANISFPVISFFLCFLMIVLFYKIGKIFWKDGTANILGYVGSMGNVGYFGLPVAIAVLPKEFIGPYLIGVLGVNIFDVSGAYFLVAKGKHTFKESIKRVFMLPTLYTFFLGITIQLIHIPLSQSYFDLVASFRGAYVILGMMLVGLGIAGIKSFTFDFLFIFLAFLAKFIVWPILVFILIFIDNSFFHLYGPGLHNVLIILSIVPIAANSVAYSTQFNLHPEKVALTVFMSTLFALIYIPMVVNLLIR